MFSCGLKIGVDLDYRKDVILLFALVADLIGREGYRFFRQLLTKNGFCRFKKRYSFLYQDELPAEKEVAFRTIDSLPFLFCIYLS